MGIAKTLKKFLGNVLLTTVDNKTIEDYKSYRVSKGLKPNSTNRELMIIRVMMKKAFEWGFLHIVPRCKLLKVPIRPVAFLSVEEIDRLIEHSSIWLKPILVVLRNTGMRIGELLNLRFQDIDLEKKIIIVRSNKTNNYRVVPMNDELTYTIEWLSRNYINPKTLKVSIRHSDQKEYLFCLRDGSNIKSIKTSFNNACSRAGIKATPHTLRHTFASHLVMNQVDLVSVKELLGHSSISTTMIYSHVSEDYKEKTVSRLPWVTK